ncbi:MAG TPA: hypothetical protein VIW68_12725 [Candidatus Sulfotelmatobacter sp.]
MKIHRTTRAVFAALAVLCFAFSAHAQGGGIGSFSSPVINNYGRPIPGANIAICAPLATTAATVANNVAALTMASNPQTAGFVPGMTLMVAGFTGGDTYFNLGLLSNGQIINGATILSVTSTTITYTLSHANGSASSNGTALQEGNSSTACAGLAGIFADPALSAPLIQPLISDAFGNWGAFVATGVYYAQFYGSTLSTTTRLFSVLGGVGGLVNCPTNGGLFYQNGSPNTGTCDTGFVYGGNGGLVTLKGAGGGSFTPSHLASLINFEVTNGATQNFLWTNSNAVGSGSALSNCQGSMSNGGVGGLFCGNTVGDGSGNYSGFVWSTGNTQLFLGTQTAGHTFDVIAGFTGGVNAADIFRIFDSPCASYSGPACGTPGPQRFGFNSNGNFELFGSSSGVAALTAAAVAGTPNPIAFPTTTGSAGQLLQNNGGNPQQTAWVSIVQDCGSTSGAVQACAKTPESPAQIIRGDVQLNTATNQSITTLPFTSATSYSCSGSDLTNSGAIVGFNTYAAASVTITENGGANTDHLRYICVGF